MSDASFSVVLTARSDDTGVDLVYNFFVFDTSSGTPVRITDPARISYITINCATTVAEGADKFRLVFAGDSLSDNGTLVSSATITGLTPLGIYSSTINVNIVGTTYTPTNTVLSVVRGGIQNITPNITGSDGDEEVTIYFDSSSALYCEQIMQNYDISVNPLNPYDPYAVPSPDASYSNLFALVSYNYGNRVTGLQSELVNWGAFKAANYSILVPGLINDVSYEVWGNYLDNSWTSVGGISQDSPQRLVLVPTNKPNPPTTVATISTLEYNRDNSLSEYTVQDASSVSILFQTPIGQDPTTQFYTIYKYDLSSNGYSNPIFDASFNIRADASGTYPYDDISYNYLFQENDVAAGSFYAYSITGTNANGEGVPTPLYGVREGQKCSAPSITSTLPGNTEVFLTITDPSSNTRGGFDFSNNGYTIAYTPQGQSIQYVYGRSAGANTITGLTNNVPYTFNTYATTSNNKYTTPGTDVSSNNLGPLLNYLSIVSNQTTITPYVLPPFPTEVATISSFEYNRYNAPNIYSVTDASSVSILFNPSVGQDPSALIQTYRIYKYDLSNNGYSDPSFVAYFDVSAADIGAPSTYVDSNDVSLNYVYRYVDPNVGVGRFYGYAISGINIYTEGPLSPQTGVRDGQKCSAPGISTSSGNGQINVTITDPSLNTIGGFDFSNNGYTVAYQNNATGAVLYATGLSAGTTVPITGLTNGTTYTFNAYATTSNNKYTTVGTDVSSNNQGPLINYLSAVSNTSTSIPYVPPPPPVSVRAALDYSGNSPNEVPTGYVNITWDASAQFEGSTVYYQLYRGPVASGQSLLGVDFSGTSYQDIGATLGTPTTYYAKSYIVVASTIAVSTTDTSSNSVVPFVPPSAPNVTASVDGLNALFSLTPPGSTGGLLPTKYNARVQNAAGALLIDPNPYTDISANRQYTTSDISANINVFVAGQAYVSGPDPSGNPKFYYSPQTTEFAGLTKAVPEINNQYIDSSGILWFTTNNNGSLLNFAEAIIVDTSGVLNLSINTTVPEVPSGSPSVDISGNMTVVENTSTQSLIRVNFNDPLIPRPQNTPESVIPYRGSVQDTLIVAANIRGANVYNTL